MPLLQPAFSMHALITATLCSQKQCSAVWKCASSSYKDYTTLHCKRPGRYARADANGLHQHKQRHTYHAPETHVLDSSQIIGLHPETLLHLQTPSTAIKQAHTPHARFASQ
jgi:hypothetical protein